MYEKKHTPIQTNFKKNTNKKNPFLFFLQQLFRQQNPGLQGNGAGPGAPGGVPQQLPLQSQQYLAQQNAAYAAQQAAPYVIQPGQDPAAPYMGALIAAGVPQYYGVAPWAPYLIPQQGSQPRRPLTPSQQGAENQPYQVC